MRIPEKELAEKLVDIYAAINNYDWPTVERAAAELRDITATLTYEKPEPGTWWIVADGPNAGKVARANEHAGLSLYGDEGQVWSYTDCDSWPNLIPARFISEQELHDLNTKADQQTRDIQDLSQILDLWKTKGVYAEASVSELLAELAEANETLSEMMPAEPFELSDGALVREWNKAMDEESGNDLPWERVTAWAFMGKGDQAVLRRFAHNLLAKIGHGREEVTREQVLDAVEDAMTLAIRSGRRYQEPIVDAFMNLLGGDDRG